MQKRALVFAFLGSLAAAGCDSGPRLVSVTGKVTRDGAPVEGAEVIFVPDPSNAQGLPGIDVTKSGGEYSANTRDRRGLIPGKYQVTVKKVILNNTAEAAPGAAAKEDPRFVLEIEQFRASHQPGKTGKKVTLPDYIDKIEQTFDREVPQDGGTIDLELKTKAAIAKK